MIIELAELRAKAAHKAAGLPRGSFRVAPVEGGEHIAVTWHDDEDTERLRVDLTPAEARELAEGLNESIWFAKQITKQVYGIVSIAWCRTDGDPARNESVRGRIVERADSCVRIAIEPERWQREPREGWPQDGWYQLNGWPMGHNPKRRGWCVVSGMPARETARG